ncbi:matrixin family metalloprotease [Methanolobus sp. ZRKC3]|uniref:matrixin family metalloprotease n=1 Tax=Methanolobus sp. ZRKC3 TaxID=3125786 RepID=UPI00325271DE
MLKIKRNWAIAFAILLIFFFASGESVYPKLNPMPWENKTITVYIDDENVPEHYSPTYRIQVEKALEYWSSGGNDKLEYIPEFKLVDEDNADILIMWVENLEADTRVQDGVAGFARPYERNNRYERVEIVLEVGNFQGYAWRQYSDTTMRDLARHELGHALGLAHSNDKKDIMFPSYEQRDNVNPLLLQATRPFLILGVALASALILYRGAGWMSSKKRREELEKELFDEKKK